MISTDKNETKEDDTYSYRGWLVSDHYWKRMLAIQGYGLVMYIIIMIPLVILSILAGIAVGMSS